jgi:hypothetical protein
LHGIRKKRAWMSGSSDLERLVPFRFAAVG